MVRRERSEPSLLEAAFQRVRVFGMAVPAWIFVVSVAISGACLAWLASAYRAPSPLVLPGPVESASAALALPAQPPPPIASSASVVDHSRRVNLAELKQLERRPPKERSLDENVALATGHAALKRSDLAALVSDVRDNPALLDDVNTLRALHSYAFDPEVAIQALAAISQLEHTIGPDLLFEVWARDVHAASATLARDLLHRGEVRQRATPALEVALALMEATSCRSVSRLLPAAIEHADRRAQSALSRLRKSDGCGAKRDEDCHPCLREEPASAHLREARDKVRSRPSPAPWTSRKVQVGL